MNNHIVLAICCILALLQQQLVHSHTWMFSKGRAWMQASLDKPFRERVLAAGQGTHAQVGPNQTMVVRWASSHNNTFTLTVVAGVDEEWFYHEDYYSMVDDYIDSAPPNSNEAVTKPRYHGASRPSIYINNDKTCAGGYCVENLFKRQLPSSDPAYFDHTLDMGLGTKKWKHYMYEYNPEIVHDEVSGTWEKQPDRRVAYQSKKYPWLVAAYRFHNKVNMHSDWDLVHMDFPSHVFTDEHIAKKGQHFIVHFSSRSRTDNTYTDAIDVNLLQENVHPVEQIYGKFSGTWGWTKTDHCQFTEPREVVSPIRDATETVLQCHADMSSPNLAASSALYGINVVPVINPDVVPTVVVREQENVDPLCLADCAPVPTDLEVKTAGVCRLKTANEAIAVCAAPAKIHNVAWANPPVSGVQYDTNTISGARPGDYIAFQWDDVVHDVWLVPSNASDPCNISAEAVLLIPPSHHATVDPNTEDTVRADRNRYLIPESAAGKELLFVCSVNGHCQTGMQLIVTVGSEPAKPDPKLTEGVCAEGYILCPDQTKQTATKESVETKVNIPTLNAIGAESLQLTGKVTRASTPWDNWTFRKLSGKKCRQRGQNTNTHSKYPEFSGVDWGNRPVWEFPDSSLREVLEACSSSHPDTCTGISWKSGTPGLNFSEIGSPTKIRSYSSASRTSSQLNENAPGWVSGGTNQWMQLDLGEAREIIGIVTQARGNNCCGPMGVTEYHVKYSLDGVNFTDINRVMKSATVDWLANNWTDDMNAKFNAFFPEIVTARFVRIYPKAWYRLSAMRADVLLPRNNDIFKGKHSFRRCLETGDYTRVIDVGPLTEEESRNFSVPSEFKKTVACEGCYQCREVPLHPWYGQGDARKQDYTFYKGHWSAGFNPIISQAGTSSAKLTVSLLHPVRWKDYRLSWEHHNPQFICRINPEASPLEPELITDEAWTTFLPPATIEGTDAVINALSSGFQPPEAVHDFHSLNQNNLDVVYPPGAQVNPNVTGGPYYNQQWLNKTTPHHHFDIPKQTLNGDRGGYWPPKPVLKVSFMPPVTAGEWYWRLYPHGYDSTGAAELIEKTKAEGWYVDHGEAEREHQNRVRDENMTFGWRCKPVMAWYSSYWREHQRFENNTWGRYEIIPPYVYGAARDIGKYFSADSGTSHDRCPDGAVNAWEAHVPNGVYTVTVHYDGGGCTFENVRGNAGTYGKVTFVYSIEVSDGKFTLSSATPEKGCGAVSWLKLDMVSDRVFPNTWLPPPAKEWWQMELDQPATGIGLVQIRLPHEAYRTASHYPYYQDRSFPDCRKWWLYSPAKCYRQFMRAKKIGVHPNLVSYPDFPGFTEAFLNWVFDQHDTNNDNQLVYEEFRSSQQQQALTGTFSMWSRPGPNNVKGTNNYHDDNAAHLWFKLDVFHDGYNDKDANNLKKGDGKVTRSEFLHGILSRPLTSFCDYFEMTANTHGGNLYEGTGSCQKNVGGEIPDGYGYFPDDGDHGFVVSISNLPCTDRDGCPLGSQTTVCEKRLHRTSSSLAQVDCGGATGKYLHISLPGNGNRILPQVTVTVHGTSVLEIVGNSTNETKASLSTNPRRNMLCYGVVPRPVPAANDPDLLAGAKLHPKTIVNDNPEDPIFWSTCYDRVIIKEWLPTTSESQTDASLQFTFDNGTYCLDCESYLQNYFKEYNVTQMTTRQWWLQPNGTCADCNRELFPWKYSSSTTSSSVTTETSKTSISQTKTETSASTPKGFSTSPMWENGTNSNLPSSSYKQTMLHKSTVSSTESDTPIHTKSVSTSSFTGSIESNEAVKGDSTSSVVIAISIIAVLLVVVLLVVAYIRFSRAGSRVRLSEEKETNDSQGFVYNQAYETSNMDMNI
eukprot:m.22963 g.22963  ORF g.22963 m.22963 type:complete len:1851 (-) comp7454_c0_seq1:181-5733(-)